ncbi:hypothetical protein [Pseudomonas sp. C11]|uniref:hypothetical protein n=1 Tax=Pseudomonas sp. C11 TaxID=3075550 RepID=UPI002AFF1C39|nr:hypothetical protein [Pseudomonas sp. C11]
MTMSNIEKFDEITGEVFAKLYLNFPVPCLLRSAEYVANSTEYNEHIGADVPTKEAEFFFASIRWLEDAGYIATKAENEFYVAEVVLTSKGLEVLRAMPSSLQGKASIGERLGDTAAKGGKEIARMLVSEALALGTRIVSQKVGIAV